MAFNRRDLVSGLALVPAASLLYTPLPATAQKSVGRFIGEIVARWNADGREMTLTGPFEFVGPDGQSWPVPTGTTVDGASIPRAFWTFIGGPFEGSYRSASVVHDFYCQVKTRPYRDVHRMFLEGMEAAGVSSSKSFIMYHAVNRFGPRWSNVEIDPKCLVVDENYDFAACSRNAAPALAVLEVNEENLTAFIEDIETEADPSDVAALKESLSAVR